MEQVKQKKPRAVKPRKSRSDSVSAAQKIAAAAFKDVKPPATIRMTPRDLEFFDAVVAEFAKAHWTLHQLQQAAMLARAMNDLEEQQFELRKEGMMQEVKTKKKENKYKVVNPRKQLVQMCASTVLSLRRSLALHARAREGEGRDSAKKRAMEKGIENDVSGFDDEDGLIARPNSVN